MELVSGRVEEITVPTPSGKCLIIVRCTDCKVAVWSNYHMGGLRERIRFIRVGTLDADDQMMPDVHIFTHSKQPWVILPETDRRVAEFYKYKDIWSAEGLDRLSQLERSAGFTIF